MDAQRENLFIFREGRLSDEELLAFVLDGRFPSKNSTISTSLASLLLNKYGNLLALRRSSPGELSEISGISLNQACTILAALELGARSHSSRGSQFAVTCSQDVYDYYSPSLSHLSHEQFHVMCLDARHCLIRDALVAIGGSATCVLEIKDALVEAIRYQSQSVIFVHNHPSGDPDPSPNDYEMTSRLQRACNAIGIKALDHIIIGRGCWRSIGGSALEKYA